MAKEKKSVAKVGTTRCLYTLKVDLIGGFITEEFFEKNPVVSRTIQLRGDQTLEDLHWAVYEAFDREEEHLYLFEFGGRRPGDRKAVRYVSPYAMDDVFGDEADKNAAAFPIGQLHLRKGRRFYYLFDFGDDWWHEIVVEDIGEEIPEDQYPKLVAKVGDSPPQYPDLDEEDWGEEDGDDLPDEDNEDKLT